MPCPKCNGQGGKVKLGGMGAGWFNACRHCKGKGAHPTDKPERPSGGPRPQCKRYTPKLGLRLL